MSIIHDLAQERLFDVLAEVVKDTIIEVIENSKPGHCLRISTLPESVMRDLCAAFNDNGINADIVLLVGQAQLPQYQWEVSATKLIELRNSEKRPLLALIPPGLKAAAEDSFDVSTFVEIDLGNTSKQLRRILCEQLPDEIRDLIMDHVIGYLESSERIIEDDAIVRYYLTILENGSSHEAAGAAIYQFGLVPDFALLNVPDRIRMRLNRNLSVVSILTDGVQPLLGRIHSLKLQPNTLQSPLYEFLNRRILEGSLYWTKDIATLPEYIGLSFDNWQFSGEEDTQDQLLLYVDDLSLPTQDDSQPSGPDNPRYLDVKRTKKPIRLKWETNPKPATVQSLAYFRIELVSAENAIVWESRNIKNSKSARSYRTKNVKVSDFRDLVEDGIYFFRVRAYSESGEIINLENAEENSKILRDPRNSEGKRINESEDVWFWIDDTAPPPVDPQRNVSVVSYSDALVRMQLDVIERGDNPLLNTITPNADKTGWAKTSSKRPESIYHIVYDSQTRYSLSINTLLRRIETETLAKPESLGRWRLDFRDEQATHYSVPITQRRYHDTTRIPPEFMQLRKILFEVIKNSSDGLTSTTSLTIHQDRIIQYAEAYRSWLENVENDFDNEAISVVDGRHRTDALFIDIDLVEVLLPQGERVFLAAPTHPLRLLWHLQQERMGQAWIKSALEQNEPLSQLTHQARKYLSPGFLPRNLPPVIRVAHESYPEAISRFYVEQGPLTSFWSLYVREDVRDKLALRAQIDRLMGISFREVQNAAYSISSRTLSDKILRYLVQHPYTRTLKLNVFNPGDASLVVDAILHIEKERGAKPELRYEVRLFTQGDEVDSIGEAFSSLIDPERQVSIEADAFTIPSKNHLFPKLRYSRNKLDEYVKNPEEYEAHISILRDLFPIDVEPERIIPGRSSFVYGLLQEQIVTFAGNQSFYAWRRQLVPTSCKELPNDQFNTSILIGELIYRIGKLQSAVATGRYQDELVPTLLLNLPLREKGLLFQVHEYSNWVFIIDRYLGLDYFDSGSTPGYPVYLLDFTPEFGEADTDRLILTTKAIDEVVRLIRPSLDKYGLLLDNNESEIYFLELLRSLSGRLALKLLSSPNHVNEAVGLAMARLFLEQYGLLTNAIVIPLDAHSNLFGHERSANLLEDEISLNRGDLLLVSCEPDTRRIHFHVIEVKWRTDLGDLSSFISLREKIESQLVNSQHVLQEHFDPNLLPKDRLDRQVKTKELISLLEFYLERSQRYGIISDSHVPTFRKFIQDLENGYILSSAGSGLIFDFSFDGITSDEEHASLAYHRVGGNYITRLVENGVHRRNLRLYPDIAGVSIQEAEQAIAMQDQIDEDTTMRNDPTYSKVRAFFPQAQVDTVVELITDSNEGDFYESNQPSLTQDDELVNLQTDDIQSDENVGDNQLPDEVYNYPKCDVLLGTQDSETGQFGILGQAGGRFVGLDLNETNTISLFGVQGGGKSYTLGTIVEMATKSFKPVNLLPSPLASVIFHYHESQDYAPEFTSMVFPNDNDVELELLQQLYDANADNLDDVVILTSSDKLEQRKKDYPNLVVEPIFFSSQELSIKDWRFLMGAVGNQMYMKQINTILRQLREKLSLEALRHEIAVSGLSEQQKHIAEVRLNFAEQFINDNYRLSDYLRAGRLLIVDLRDEYIEKDEALGLFVVMLNIFANAAVGEDFNKLIVFDEAHKYMDNKELTRHIVEVIRQMRHQGVSILIASQDPPSLPNEIIELSSCVVLHRFNSPQWLKHVQKSITALNETTAPQLAVLRPGDAYIWASKATDRIFTHKAVKIRLRPRITKHGGTTKTSLQ